MDSQTIQALMGVFQQGLQILQTAQSGAAGAPPMANGAPGAAPGGMPGAMPGAQPGGMPEPDGDEDDDLYDDDEGDEDDDEGMGDGPGMDDDDQDGMGAASLHDRVSQLENHTGLKKSASGGLLDKVAALELQLLGTEYEGPLVARVGQLEKAAGVSPEPVAPEEIALDDLIKSAIQEGIKQYAKALPQSDDDDDVIPDLGAMRKAARNGRYGQRRGLVPEVVTDEDLVKSAANFGWSKDSLDEPVGFGDALLLQYHAQQAGEPLPFDSSDDDED